MSDCSGQLQQVKWHCKRRWQVHTQSASTIHLCSLLFISIVLHSIIMELQPSVHVRREPCKMILRVQNESKFSEAQTLQHRQLVSRAATQRLHSASLDEVAPLSTNCFEMWERQERLKSRAKARIQLEGLHITWGNIAVAYVWTTILTMYKSSS